MASTPARPERPLGALQNALGVVGVSRRAALLASLLGAAAPGSPARPAGAGALRLLARRGVGRIARLHAGGPSGLLGLAADGRLWALSAHSAAQQLAEGLDPATPLSSGHGRIAARRADGGLWVAEAAGAPEVQHDAGLAPHAGLLILPLAVIGVVAAGHRLVRFEPTGGGRWQAVARSQEAVLPDARPLQADLDGRGDGGHLVVLAGPDAQRYRHGVLGDGVEATRVLWLERHGLAPLRTLELPAPHVLEDIAPRPVALSTPDAGLVTGLLTVRSGPEGGQLALLTADRARPGNLQLAALGDPVGGLHRWLAPTTDGRHLAAVHTPHLGGVLHVYRRDGARLLGRRRLADVSTHRLGSRETDLAVWLHQRLWLPSQDGRSLRVVNLARLSGEPSEAETGAADDGALALPAPVVQALALADASAWVGLLEDGQVAQVPMAT